MDAIPVDMLVRNKPSKLWSPSAVATELVLIVLSVGSRWSKDRNIVYTVNDAYLLSMELMMS